MSKLICNCSWGQPCNSEAVYSFWFLGQIYYVCSNCFDCLKRQNPVAMKNIKKVKI